MDTVEPTWWDSVLALRGRETVPAAQLNADLLASKEAAWDRQIVARTSMHDLLFTLPGDTYPFYADVRVHWERGAFEITLARRGRIVTADRCRGETVDAVLDAFLLQLLGEGTSPTP